MYRIVILIISLACLNANAGDLVNHAEIIAVSTSNDGRSDNFYLKLSGGVGDCAENNNKGWVIFPGVNTSENPTDIPNEASWNRLYSTALMAFAAGKLVRIYSYDNTGNCAKASFIEVYK
ncbi:DUF5992 family protein [Pseudomonas sp. HK3]